MIVFLTFAGITGSYFWGYRQGHISGFDKARTKIRVWVNEDLNKFIEKRNDRDR
jgi:hypothetical protein